MRSVARTVSELPFQPRPVEVPGSWLRPRAKSPGRNAGAGREGRAAEAIPEDPVQTGGHGPPLATSPAQRALEEKSPETSTWITLWQPSTVSVTPSSSRCLRSAPLAAASLRSVLVLACKTDARPWPDLHATRELWAPVITMHCPIPGRHGTPLIF